MEKCVCVIGWEALKSQPDFRCLWAAPLSRLLPCPTTDWLQSAPCLNGKHAGTRKTQEEAASTREWPGPRYSSKARGHLDCQLSQDYLRTACTRPHRTVEEMSPCTALPLVGPVLGPGQRTFRLGRVFGADGLPARDATVCTGQLPPFSHQLFCGCIADWLATCSLLRDLALDSDSSNEIQGRCEEASIAQPLPLLIGPEACSFAFNQ